MVLEEAYLLVPSVVVLTNVTTNAKNFQNFVDVTFHNYLVTPA
jgi:hypothetical protein